MSSMQEHTMTAAPTTMPMESHLQWEHDLQMPAVMFLNHPSAPVPDDGMFTGAINLEFADFTAVHRVRRLSEEEMTKLCRQIHEDVSASSESSESCPPIQRCNGMQVESGPDAADGSLSGEQFHLFSFTHTTRGNWQRPLEASENMQGSLWCEPSSSQDTIISNFASPDTENSPKPTGCIVLFEMVRPHRVQDLLPSSWAGKASRVKTWMCSAYRPSSRPREQ
ncbi:unnamed protein product [Symbiodinium sp. CCMP2592]|nr:unnamed protein product [Symbiodinium sp. CCMP2592]